MIVSVTGVGMKFGAEEIFSGLSFNINRGERTALVGVNGAGKTTLINILTEELEPSEGDVHHALSARVALLPQQMGRFPEGPLLDSVCGRAGDAAEALERMNQIHMELEGAEEHEEREQLLRKLSDTHDLIDSGDGFNIRSRAEKVLSGLGFLTADFLKPLEDFSGGWRMRAQLASLLLADPDLLLLDEPTNHLDLDARIWLEEYLKRFRGAVWIISHDPGFLDRVVTQVYELEFGKLSSYKGNYTFYEKKKREDIATREKQAKHQAEQIEKIQRFIKRFRATESKRFQVRSREKMLEKMEVIQTHRDPSHMKLRFPDPPRSGEIVARLEGVSMKYDRTVFSDVDLSVERGDRIGIVGKNGEGKSTLSRILAGMEKPASGNFSRGSRVSTGFYTQEIDQGLNPDLNLVEQLSAISPSSSEKELRSILGGFLFTGDDAFKKTGILSGGEKSRLALARVLLSPANFLILDEPTNHLDIFSRNVLQEALEKYPGTLVLISHDEQLLSALVEKVYEVQGGKVSLFQGSFAYYLRKKQEKIRRMLESKQTDSTKTKSPRELENARKRREAAERKELYKKQKKIRIRIDRVERKLLPLEEKREQLEGLLADPDVLSDSTRIMELQREHSYVCKEIEGYQEMWNELAEMMGE
ncbi:MAG: ABC-F family ATP-binding cassette domain-containing protein [Candidatus Aegiribacteria sp.]|nr:ABC-F family ATP-binding cassette domain-containing protein [Candidatus Aegiribacteria sp.]